MDDADIVRRYVQALNGRDVDRLLALLDPAVELHTRRGLKVGHDAFRDWLGTGYDNLVADLELRSVRPAPGGRVVVTGVKRLRWKDDGSVADEEPTAALFTVRHGRIVRWQPFETAAEASAAAGLDAVPR